MTSWRRERRGISIDLSSSADNSPIDANSQNEYAAMLSPITWPNYMPDKACRVNSLKRRLQLEECELKEQDDGYSSFLGDSDEKPLTNFRFVDRLVVAPRRLNFESDSPIKSPSDISPQRKCWYRSLSSDYENTNEGFIELISTESLEKGSLTFSMQNNRVCNEETIPLSISKVRSCLCRSRSAVSCKAKIVYDESPKRRRLDNFDDSTAAPAATATNAKKFKQSDTTVDHTTKKLIKRSRKSASTLDVNLTSKSQDSPPMPVLVRSISEAQAHDHIKSAITRNIIDDDLTGDFSKSYALPLTRGKHDDLKSIGSVTLSRLIRGEFNDRVSCYKIVDCRYPYEYEAGHIEGALNLYTKELIEEQLLNPLTHAPTIEPESQKRNVIVFHCEFSVKRGPTLSRFLRNIDRQKNIEHYPALHYPEIYLLDDGYKSFFKDQKALCSPQGYIPMCDPKYEANLKRYQSKSKSCQRERVSRTNLVSARVNPKRLGF